MVPSQKFWHLVYEVVKKRAGTNVAMKNDWVKAFIVIHSLSIHYFDYTRTGKDLYFFPLYFI